MIHPEILHALGCAGHGSKVLIADGNYPFSTKANPSAKRVYLNLAPGLLRVTDVLKAIVSANPIESAEVMIPEDRNEPSIYEDFRELLKTKELQAHGRFEFYDVAMDPNTCLVIATGDQRLFANIILTLACRTSQ